MGWSGFRWQMRTSLAPDPGDEPGRKIKAATTNLIGFGSAPSLRRSSLRI